MPYSPELADRVRQVLPSLDLRESEELGEKKMFGGLCFTLSGKMLVGIDVDKLVIRLGDEDYARESEAGRALPMDFTGRPLRNFAFIPEGAFEEDSDILRWAELSAQFVRTHMLEKPGKRKKKS